MLVHHLLFAHQLSCAWNWMEKAFLFAHIVTLCPASGSNFRIWGLLVFHYWLHVFLRPFSISWVYETADLKIHDFRRKKKKIEILKKIFFGQVQYIIIYKLTKDKIVAKMFQMSQNVSLQLIYLFGQIILGDIRYVYKGCAFMCHIGTNFFPSDTSILTKVQRLKKNGWYSFVSSLPPTRNLQKILSLTNLLKKA
jgi:hypothetical protein